LQRDVPRYNRCMRRLLIVTNIEHSEMFDVDIGFGPCRRFKGSVLEYLGSNGLSLWAKLLERDGEMDELLTVEQFERLRREFPEAA